MIEDGEGKKRIHAHMLISGGIHRDELERIWNSSTVSGGGIIKAELLDTENGLEGAIVYHAYALHYVSNLPDDAEAPKLSMNINMGAKGRIQSSFEATESGSFSCFDSEGKQWFFLPNGTSTWTQGDKTDVKYNWQYSYALSTFDAKTGWSRWLKLNPVMPYGNPPIGDDGDTNE